MKKFGFTILLVVLCIILILGILLLYKKVFLKKTKTQAEDTSELSLKSPTDTIEAIDSFLERTKPNR
ncbi:MAG: hypothetical protein PHV37_01375 [Candidatus Gastranaerophilales bacterium]|nr:hypothetical protein [Candidatus Gastranaerophilales bacterium]